MEASRRIAQTLRHFGGGPRQKDKVAIIGSGNWGSAISIIIGENVIKQSDLFEPDVPMWVFDEQVNGRSLIDLINEKHENVKYLPKHKLPVNVRAVGDIREAVKDATALVFVMPHQFIPDTCKQIKGHLSTSRTVRAISLTKGVDVQETKISIFADYIESYLGISCAALSGANIADEIADGSFSETTIGYRKKDDALMWAKLMHTQQFRVSLIDDVAGVSLCGALKNVVAIAAGMSDGLGWGNNSKGVPVSDRDFAHLAAAIMRIGLVEMRRFSEEFFKGVKAETFMSESCGVADLITSCMGGRNRKCGEAFVQTGKPFPILEKELLKGQKLQGTETARELHRFLEARGRTSAYPLFDAVYRIAFEGHPAKDITNLL